MTVKKILSLLVLLTCLGASAQNPPSADTPPPAADPTRNPARIVAAATNAPAADPGFPAFPAPPAPRSRRGDTNRAAAQAVPGVVPAPAPAPGAAPAAPPTVVPAPAPATNPATTPTPTRAPAAPAKPAEEVFFKAGDLYFTGAPLDTILTKYYAELDGRNVLRSPTVEAALKSPVFFVNQTALTRSEAKQAFEALFAMNNVGLIPVDTKFVKAVPLAEAIQAGQRPMVVTNSVELPEFGQYVTYIVQLKFVKPSEMLPLLAPFQKMNTSVALDSSQILVLRDLTENVKRMLEMIERVDVAFQSEFESEVIPIKFAKAEEIASALSALSGSGSTTTVGTRAAGGTSGIGTRPGVGGYSPGSTSIPGQVNPMGNNPAGTPSSTASFSDRINQIISRASKTSTSGSGEFQIIGPNKIVADVRSNSLMVFASRQDMITIKKIIAQLDVVLAQVLIETIILDVTLTDGHSLGVSYLQKNPTLAGNFTGIGAINNTGFLTDGAFSVLTNGTSGGLPGGFSYLAHFGNDLDVTLSAVASDSNVKVVQKPRIMTSHATAASVFIGSTVPYVSGTYYGGGYGGGPSSSYQQLRVGIQLTVTPYINQDGLVVMKIDEAIDEISGSVPITGVGDVPTTTSRTLSAEVAVGDRETIMLGGFIRSSGTENKSGVPVLKDIPLLGPLFSSNSKNKTRNELMVLMRPTVLRTPQLAAAQTAIEKSRLPGIRRAEAESEADEERRVKSTDKKLGTIVTPTQGAATPTKPASTRDEAGFLPVPE